MRVAADHRVLRIVSILGAICRLVTGARAAPTATPGTEWVVFINDAAYRSAADFGCSAMNPSTIWAGTWLSREQRVGLCRNWAWRGRPRWGRRLAQRLADLTAPNWAVALGGRRARARHESASVYL